MIAPDLPASVRLAVFDCDGTLADSQAGICTAMAEAFTGAGLAPPPAPAIRRAVGLSLPQVIHHLAPDASPALHDELVDRYRTAFRTARVEGRLGETLFDGIPALLARLDAAGWRLGVATGKSQRGLVHLLATHGISDRFTTLQTADHHPSKPHPAMLEAALAEAGAAPGQAVMIGDTAFDIHMATTIGVRAIGVAWGYHEPHELTAAGAEAVAATPAELGDLLT
jgi:phosphoglycolate phosphatase